MELKPIAHIETAFPEKFGIPRQSGLAHTIARIVFEPKFRNEQALRGIEGFNYLWLIWQFEDVTRESTEGWSPTVRPPILGGNERMGVFATRSPFRPNPLGLSSVKLAGIETGNRGPELIVCGADLRNNTPIFDIKPYLAYADIHYDATNGFASPSKWQVLHVNILHELRKLLSSQECEELVSVLELDPRPAIHHDASRVYHMSYKHYTIDFTVDDEQNELFVTNIMA